MSRDNYNLPPRQIVQRTTYAWGYLNCLWHLRHLAELIQEETRRSGWKIIKQWPDRPAHPAYRHRRDRIPKDHWRHFRYRRRQR